MFEVSDEAKELLLARLQSALEGRPELRRSNSGVGLRLDFAHGGAQLSLAFPRPTDRVVFVMGRPLLIIDLLDLSRLDDVYLTVQQGPDGPALTMVPRTPDTAPRSSDTASRPPDTAP